MSVEEQGKRKFKEKLRDTYRIVVIDEENLNEVGNYKLTMAKLYTYLILSFLVVTMLMVSLIAFTPMKRWMPGYGDIEENVTFVEIREKIYALEEELETQIVYTQGLQNMLSGSTGISDSNLEVTNSNNSPHNSPHNTSQNTTHKHTIKISKYDLVESQYTRTLNNHYFVSPVLGSISAPYDRAGNHLGVDVLAPKNTAVKSIASGVVIGSDFTLDTGNTISIQHKNNIISIYKHNSALLKKAGDKINAGEAIAIIGNTGTLSDGPHLHFELWYDGNPVNPENFINFK